MKLSKTGILSNVHETDNVEYGTLYHLIEDLSEINEVLTATYQLYSIMKS